MNCQSNGHLAFSGVKSPTDLVLILTSNPDHLPGGASSPLLGIAFDPFDFEVPLALKVKKIIQVLCRI